MTLGFDRFRHKLQLDRRALAAADALTEADCAPVALDQESVGRLSRIDAMQVQAMALAQTRRRQARRAAIDAALARLDEGEFGYCLKCGEQIASARLENDPSVTTCIGCAGNPRGC
jgi:DnaK suppressor protein